MRYFAGAAMCVFNGHLGCNAEVDMSGLCLCALVVDLLISVQSHTRNMHPSESLLMECFKIASVFAVSLNI